MENNRNNCLTQLVDEDGEFNVTGADTASKKLAAYGINYRVVSIIGPQSSGKSTLMNHIFQTTFPEMDFTKQRQQTTKGIWYEIRDDIEPCTIVIDVEGIDGKERKDNVTFEKQSALFALAASDIVMINMFYTDIGRQEGGCRSLMKIVFEVMMKVFQPRRTSLLFVIRDMSPRATLEVMTKQLVEGIQEIYDSIPKSASHKETPMRDVFDIHVIGLPNYEEEHHLPLFKEKIAALRSRFIVSTSGGLAEASYDSAKMKVPGSEFSRSTQMMWECIKDNKDIDLPAQTVLIATVRCEQIAEEKLANFIKNEDWNRLAEGVQSQNKSYQEWFRLAEEVQSHLISGFGKRLSTIIGTCLSEYDADTNHFDTSVRNQKRVKLQDDVLQLVQPTYESMMKQQCTKSLADFKRHFNHSIDGADFFTVTASNLSNLYLSEFMEKVKDASIEQAEWDSATYYDKLRTDINAHVSSTRELKVSQLTRSHEDDLKRALSKPVQALLGGYEDKTWLKIRNLLQQKIRLIEPSYVEGLERLNIEKETLGDMLSSFSRHGRNIVESVAKDAAEEVLTAMQGRFTEVFNQDENSMPRTWTAGEDIMELARMACSEAGKLLSVLVVIQLDKDIENIESILSAFLYSTGNNHVAQEEDDSSSSIPLASSTWEEVPPNDTLITPVKCISLWKDFKSNVHHHIVNALRAQENASNNSVSSKLKILNTATSVLYIATTIGSLFMAPGMNFGKAAGVAIVSSVSKYLSKK